MKRFPLPVLALGLALAAASAQAQLKPPPAAAPAAQAADASAPIDDPATEKAGETAAHAWLLLLDRKDWGTAWDASSRIFRQNVPLNSWMDRIPGVRDPLGPLVERQPLKPMYRKVLPGYPAGDYVTVEFASKFKNKPDAQEIVTTVRDSDGHWRVTGYSTK
jgi:hypothetical protein